MWRLVSLCFALFAFSASALAQGDIPSDSRLKAIVGKKVIRIAYRNDATPYSFVNAKNEPVGYTIDLCQMVVRSIAQQLGLQELKIEWVPVTVQTRFTAVTGNQADMECGSSTVTLGRMKEMDFSNLVFIESTGILVARASNFRSVGDMAGKRIAVIGNTTNEQALKDHVRERRLDVTLLSVKDREEGIAALESGKVDGYASDKLLLVGAKIKQPDAIEMLPDDLSIEPYAIVLPRGDWAFRVAVNTGLAQVYRSGQSLEVFKRWFDPVGLRPSLLLRAIYALGSVPN